MRWRRLVERCGWATPSFRDCLEVRWKKADGNRELDRGWLDGGLIQPHHSSFIGSYFGAVVIVRLEVSMGDSVRMVRIGFVNVLNRDNG